MATMKQLPAHYLGQPNTATQAYTTYVIGAGRSEAMPEGYAFEDLFNPEFWAHHVQGARALRPGDLIRARAADGSWDCVLSVVSVIKGGAIMELWPKYPAGSDAKAAKAAVETAEAARPRKVQFLPDGRPAIRVDFTKATKYRVIALDQTEQSSDHDTEAQARKAMLAYVAELRMEYPSAEEIAEKAAEAEAATAKRKAAVQLKAAAATAHKGV